MIHGDYQEGNLFFVDDATGGSARISDIIDWDQVYRAPRAWEVIRTLDLCFALEPRSVRAFLAAYRSVAPLPDDALDTTAQAYSWMRAHDFWVYDHIYAQGNTRYQHYIGPAPFVPFTDGWLALRATLTS
ncbi:MAG: phosphotransferase [Ktedonobacterales bacterium]